MADNNYDGGTNTQKGGNMELVIPLGLTMLAHWLADRGDNSLLDRLESGVNNSYDSLMSYMPFSGSDDLENNRNMRQQQSNRSRVSPRIRPRGRLLGQRRSRNEQDGGVGFGNVVLKSLEQLIVPLGLMSGAHLLQNRNNNLDNDYYYDGQRGGNWDTLLNLSVPLGLTALAFAADSNRNRQVRNIRRNYRSQEGGDGWSLPIIGDTALGKWLTSNNISVLSPQTLLPLGIIFVLYWAYRRYAQPDPNVILSEKPSIYDMANPEDLEEYARQNGIQQLDANTQFPYALAMGPDVFNAYVNQNGDRNYETQTRSRQRSRR